jgi:hypothetical protein
LRIKEQATRLTPLYEHDDDDDDNVFMSQLKPQKWCSNRGSSTRNFSMRGSMDWFVKMMMISFLMELYLMVFSSLLRTISKYVSVEQDDYLNYNDLSHTQIPVNIQDGETHLNEI